MLGVGMIPGGKLGMKVVGSGFKAVRKNYNFVSPDRKGYKIYSDNGTLSEAAINNAKKTHDQNELINSAIPSGFHKYRTKHFNTSVGKKDAHFYMNNKKEVYYGLDYKSKIDQ